jgi:opacity protein-like surface antigen
MSPKISVAGLTAAIIWAALTGPASAQSVDGFYVRVEAGRTKSTKANIQDRNFAEDHGITGEGGNAGTLPGFGGTWLAGAGVGIRFSPRFRADVGYIYRGNFSMDEQDHGVVPTNFQAKISSNSVLATGYADFPILDSGVSTFLGLGAGWSQNVTGSLSAVPFVGSLGLRPTRIAPGGTTDNFAWQFVAGLSVLLSGNLSVDVFYRFFDGGQIQTAAGNLIADGNVIGTYHGLEGAFMSDEFGISLRLAFSPRTAQ